MVLLKFDRIAAFIFAILLVKLSTGQFMDNFCLRTRFFSIEAKDASFMSHVIAKYKALSEMECGHRCLVTPKCVSFNYENDVETSAHICEVNDETETSPGDLVLREGFSYFKMVNILCSTAPCQNGATCHEDCDGNYKCACSVGYTGTNCEKIMASAENVLSATSCDDKPCNNNGSCYNTSEGYACMCVNGFQGKNCEYGESCKLLKMSGSTSSGIYNISVPGLGVVPVYCDQEKNGGGWTLIQRRTSPYQLDFDKNWIEYKNGFGDLKDEFWIGNEKIYALANTTREFFIILRSSDGEAGSATYSNFCLRDEDEKYLLKVHGFSGNISDCGGDSNWQRFTTKDDDNDEDAGGNCAQTNNGGWWYKNCNQCGNLNRAIIPKWDAWSNREITSSEMSIR